MVHCNAITNRKRINSCSNLLYYPSHLMSKDWRSNVVAMHLLKVSPADSTRFHPYEHFTGANVWGGHFSKLNCPLTRDNRRLQR